jgi:hypothetical protein
MSKNKRMKERYGGLNFEEIAKGFSRAADILRMENPDFVLVPVAGSVPFIDILHIVDRKFDVGSAVYIPNSSRFADREKLMSRWYQRFYRDNEVGKPIKFVCIDEVLSGSSAVVGHRQFERSIEQRARDKANEFSGDRMKAYETFKKGLGKHLSYRILGIAERGHLRNPQFRRLVHRGVSHAIEFDDVPTIDNVALNALRFRVERVQRNGRPIYAPEIDRFDITQEYIDLLKGVASYVGVDPSSVGPVNLGRIEEGLALAREES